MASGPLSHDTRLGVQLGAICSRNQYTSEPAPVIAALRETAGARTDILASEIGQWIGYYDSPETRTLVDALRAAFADLDMQPGIELGQQRRDIPWHSTPGTPR